MKIFVRFVVLGCLLAGVSFADQASGKVTFTRLPEEIKGFEKLGVVHGKASRVFGDQDKLRDKAIAQAEAEAEKLGATVILITSDNFAPTPINNVTIEAVAYRHTDPAGKQAESGGEEKKQEPVVVATDPAKIETTRLAGDVKGKTKLGVVHGKASRFFGDQDALREKALTEAKAAAAKLGATVILITVDNFEPTPINNVAIEAVAFK